MGAYNTVGAKQVCPSCHNVVEFKYQFKYGELWQYEYQLGEEIKWGKKNDGKPGARRVVVYAAAEPCPICGYDDVEEYEVWLENDRLVKVIPASGQYNFSQAGNTYIVLDE